VVQGQGILLVDMDHQVLLPSMLGALEVHRRVGMVLPGEEEEEDPVLHPRFPIIPDLLPSINRLVRTISIKDLRDIKALAEEEHLRTTILMVVEEEVRMALPTVALAIQTCPVRIPHRSKRGILDTKRPLPPLGGLAR